MMTFDVYICAFEQKLVFKETTTKDNEHREEEMLASKD
jgi:hypothetical protein